MTGDSPLVTLPRRLGTNEPALGWLSDRLRSRTSASGTMSLPPNANPTSTEELEPAWSQGKKEVFCDLKLGALAGVAIMSAISKDGACDRCRAWPGSCSFSLPRQSVRKSIRLYLR